MKKYEKVFFDFSRMCKESRGKRGGCFNCPLESFREDMKCIAVLVEYPAETARIVHEWATENQPKTCKRRKKGA